VLGKLNRGFKSHRHRQLPCQATSKIQDRESRKLNLYNAFRSSQLGDSYRYLREWLISKKKPSNTGLGFRFVGNKIMSKGAFETNVVNLVVNESKLGARTFIDVGAHHGYFTCLAGSLGLKCFAFEPDPLNYRILKRNIHVNQFKNVLLENSGISDVTGQQDFFGFSTGVSTLEQWAGDVSRRKFQAQVVRLDEFFDIASEIQIPLILKIDVEGHECQVVDGAENLLRSTSDITVICEITFRSKQSSEGSSEIQAPKVVRTLVDYGFEPFLISGDGKLQKLTVEQNMALLSGDEQGISGNFAFRKFT